MGEPAARVLVVDDDERFAVALSVLLETAGFDVVGVAHDGADALSQIETLRPALVTMDVDMPLLDGRRAAELIASRYPDITIVFVAGSPTEAPAGVGAARVPKGAAFEQLVPALRRAVDASGTVGPHTGDDGEQ